MIQSKILPITPEKTWELLSRDDIPVIEKPSSPDSEERLPGMDVNYFVYKLLCRKAFDDKDFCTLIRFLSSKEIPESYPLDKGERDKEWKLEALARDAEKIFPLFLEFLRREYFSVNEPIPWDIMIALGKVPLENEAEESVAMLARKRLGRARSKSIPSIIQQSVEEIVPPENNDNRDKSVSGSKKRNEELKRYRNEERTRLKTNPIVQRGILDYVKARNEEVMSSRCSDQYNALSFNLFLLWADIDFSLMKSMYSGKFDEIETLLADSSAKIDIFIRYTQGLNAYPAEKWWDTPENLVYQLQRHVQICETLNKLALIHAVNFEERQVSLVLGNLIRENIDGLLKNLKPLIWDYPDLDCYSCQLDDIAGKVWWNSVRGRRISGSSVEEIQEQGWEMEQELQEAFERRSGAHFWCALSENPAEREKRARMILKGETAVIRLIMSELISNLPDQKSQQISQERSWSIQDLVEVYQYAIGIDILTKDTLIRHFMDGGAKNTKNDFPIEVVYNIVLFDDSIPENTLADLVCFFLEHSQEPKSSSYEEYTVKIISQIVRKLRVFRDRVSFIPLIDDVRNLLESMDVSRHVLNYSKLYLALALYYIESPKAEHIGHAKHCFAHYKSLTMHLESDEKVRRYEKDEEWFYATLGYSMFSIDLSEPQLSTLSNHQYYPSFVKLGNNTMIGDTESRRNAAVSGIAKTSSDMIASMTGDGDINRIGVSFWKDIEKRIAKTVFYNICTVEIRCGSHENVSKKREYDTREILLNSDSSIIFTYPLSSEKLFDRIFSQYQDLIRQDIGNLIAIYNAKMEDERKNRELELTNAKLEVTAFHDPETWLSNKNKLKKDLEETEKNGQTRTILLIEVPDYQSIINTVGGSKKWNERMKQAQVELECANNSQWENSRGMIYKQSDSSFAIVFECQFGTPENFTNLLEGGSFLFYMGAAIWETEDVLSKANIALSKAIRDRKHGDRTLKIFTPEDQNSLDTLNQNTEILRQALDRNNEMVRLVPYCQPICDEDGVVVKYEALARIEKKGENERITVIPPWCFIKIAEDIGRSADITKAILAQIIEDLKGDATLHISVNMDAQSWNNREVMKMLEEIHQCGFSKRVTVEILETVELGGKDDMIQVEHLKSLGLALAIDDYGKWQSGPERVADIGGEFIKIDMDTVKRLENKDTRATGIMLIKSAVSLAKDLGMKTVAEWIETKEVFDLLKGCEVDLFQWYYFSKPLPSKELRGIRVFPRG